MRRFASNAAFITVLTGVLAGGPALTASAAVASAAHRAPHVFLSPSAPGVRHNADGTWTVPLAGAGGATRRDTGFCRGTYFVPSIVARGNGTAVHFGTKYFCTEPVEYTVEAGVEDWYEESPTGPVLGHLGADTVTRSGVSQQPTADGYSYPCKNNQNSGWEPYDFSRVHGQQHNGIGNRTTVGCRV